MLSQKPLAIAVLLIAVVCTTLAVMTMTAPAAAAAAADIHSSTMHHSIDTRIHQSRKVFARAAPADAIVDGDNGMDAAAGAPGPDPIYPPTDPSSVEQRDQSAAIASDFQGGDKRHAMLRQGGAVVDPEQDEQGNNNQQQRDIEREGDDELSRLQKAKEFRPDTVAKASEAQMDREMKDEAEFSNLRKDASLSGVFSAKKKNKKNNANKRKTHVQRYKEWQKGLYEEHKLGLKEQATRDKQFEQNELAPEYRRDPSHKMQGDNEAYTTHMQRVQRGDKPLRPSPKDMSEDRQSAAELKFGYKDRADAEGLSEAEAERDLPGRRGWDSNHPSSGNDDEDPKEHKEKKTASGASKRKSFNPESADDEEDDEEDDESDSEQRKKKKTYVRGPSGISREERRKIRKKAHIMTDDEFDDLQSQIGRSDTEDPGKCQAVASRFCKGLMYSFAEFTACAIREKARFTGTDAHCLDDFVEIYDDCAPDMVKLCGGMDSLQTNKCLLSPEAQPRVSEACKTSEFWELLAMESATLNEIQQKIVEEEEEAFAHDPQGLAALRQAREKAHKRMSHPDHDPSRYVKTARVSADNGIEDLRAAGAKHRYGGLDKLDDDPMLTGLKKKLRRNHVMEVYEHEGGGNIEMFDGDDL